MNYSPEEIAKIGQTLYFQELQENLEKAHMHEYVVIDVEKKEYVVNKDKLAALEEARNKFGEKLFYIIHIGNLQKAINYKQSTYAWKF